MSRRSTATGLLVDLDGVLRRWDPEILAGVERLHGLASGSLLGTALSRPLLRPAISGEITHDEWMAAVVRALSDPPAGGPVGRDATVGDLASAAAGMVAGAPFAAAAAVEALAAAEGASVPSLADRAAAAVREWQAYRGEVDRDVLALVREVRAAGLPVGLATNATDKLDADLEMLGLTDEVDAVINSSVVGSPKPAKEFFAAAAQALRLPPDRLLLVDDDDRAVRGARVAGLSAYRWTGPADAGYVRAVLGL